MEESISIEEIRELALRYINENECVNIPERGEAFALLMRKIPVKKKADWVFAGYGIVADYTSDADEKPFGKWINMKYISLSMTTLAMFPPITASIRLQPPHIAKGCFQNFDRSAETKIVVIDDLLEKESGEEAQIIQFPGK